jgi:hypothetical protein
MRTIWIRTLVIAVVGITLGGFTSCVFQNGDLVLNEMVCVNIEETQTDGSFSTFVVVEDFKEALEKKLEQNGNKVGDIQSIHMVSATFKTMSVQPHDWTLTGDVSIARQDTEGGAITDGPALLVSFDNQSLKDLRGRPTDADLVSGGVEVVNRALEALLNGEDPRLILQVDNESASPVPSESDPMSFKVRVCVNFQMVVEVAAKNK